MAAYLGFFSPRESFRLTEIKAWVLYEFHGLLPNADDLLKLIRQAADL